MLVQEELVNRLSLEINTTWEPLIKKTRQMAAAVTNEKASVSAVKHDKHQKHSSVGRLGLRLQVRYREFFIGTIV